MKWFVFGFIFLLLTTTTHAHDDPLEDCYELDILQPYCAQVTNAINTSQITEEEGKQLLLNYMAPKNYLPQFEFTQTWNTLITPDRTPPYNLSSESKTCDIDSGVNCIDYAWLAIFGVYNAFIENNTLYTEDNGYIHTAFYYEFNKPNDWETLDIDKDGEWPESKLTGECRKKYFLGSDNSEITIEIDGTEIATHPLSSIPTLYTLTQFTNLDPGEHIITSTLNLQNELRREVYEWSSQWICIPIGEDNVCGYINRCDTLVAIESPVESKTLETSEYKIERYEKTIQPIITTIEESENTPRIILETENPDYKITLGDAEVLVTNSLYYINYTLPHYDPVYVHKKEEHSHFGTNSYISQAINNLVFTTEKHNTQQNCSATIYYPFTEDIVTCNSSLKTPVNIFISLDKNKPYDVGETVKINININGPTENVPVEIKYGTNKQTIDIQNTGYIEFNAEKGNTKVTATYEGDNTYDKATSNTITTYASETDFIDWIAFIAIIITITIPIIFIIRLFTRRILDE